MLELRKVETSYSQSQVLFGLDLQINVGEVVTLLGRNGMGKTTTIHSIMGLARAQAGEIIFDGDQVRDWPPHRVAQAGIGLVPEGRQIFPNLTVLENLIATAADRSKNEKPWNLERVFDLFPHLPHRANHMGNQLSGGEQQMLAIGRALLTNPELLILDEATEGLAPLTRAEIWKALQQLTSTGLALIVIDKNIGPLLRLADRHYVMEKGRIVWQGVSDELRAHPEILQEYVGV